MEHARERGLDLATIRTLLLGAGWKDRDIVEAFSSGALEMAVPEPRSVGSARDVFLHMLAFTTLYTWVVSLVVLLFTYVNLALPDPAWETRAGWRDAAYDSIRAALASLIVAFPLFLVLWGGLLRDLRRHPEKARASVRRALMYLSLFVGAVTLLTDTITLVYRLIEGELSLRFLLKVAILFVVAGAVFVYLMLTLRTEGERTA